MSKSRIPYFDFYPADFMHGIRGLTATEVGVYTMLLCRIYEENGPVEFIPVRLSAYCGIRESALLKAVDRLVVLGKLTIENDMMSNPRAMTEIHTRETKLKNNSRAGKASADKRQQNQQKSATAVQQPFNHTDTDTDTDKKEDTNVSLSEPRDIEPRPFDEVAEAVSAYNDAAESNGWPKVQKLTPARRSSLKARLRDAGGNDGWRCAIDKAAASDFLCGRSGRDPFFASFDFLTRQSSFTKLMEGSYDNRTSPSGNTSNRNTGRSGPHHDLVAAFAQVAAQRSGRA